MTSVVQHDIVTELGVCVKLKPYQIPKARRKDISDKVKRMLELSIVMEASSD